MEKLRVTLNEISQSFQLGTTINLNQDTTQAQYCIGPFKQVLTLNHLPARGALQDQQLEVLTNAGMFIERGIIQKIFFKPPFFHPAMAVGGEGSDPCFI